MQGGYRAAHRYINLNIHQDMHDQGHTCSPIKDINIHTEIIIVSLSINYSSFSQSCPICLCQETYKVDHGETYP